LELKPSIKERSLKAFLELAILRILTSQPMTAYDINHHFMKKHGVFISPSTIYRNLSAMEKNGWIKCIRNRHGKVYAPTQHGQEIMNNAASIIGEIQSAVKVILKN